jgi:hypothetical protein
MHQETTRMTAGDDGSEDEHSFSSTPSTSTVPADTPRVGTNEASLGIATKETSAIRWIRAIVTAVVILSTLAVALSVFYYMNNTEHKRFVYRFKSDSFQILESIGSTFDRSLGSIDAFAVGLVSSVKQSNQTWPYVSLSDFPVQSSKILSLSKGILFIVYNYITHQQRPLWNRYSSSHDGWVDESLDVQEKAWNRTYFGPLDRNISVSEDIYQSLGETVDSDFYLVQWQSFPVIPSKAGFPVYNWDFWEYPGDSAKAMYDMHQPTISYAYNLPDLDDPTDIAYHEVYAESYRQYLPPGRDPHEPMSEIYYVRRILLKSLDVKLFPHFCNFTTSIR